MSNRNITEGYYEDLTLEVEVRGLQGVQIFHAEDARHVQVTPDAVERYRAAESTQSQP
jgi:hypothetical protein